MRDRGLNYETTSVLLNLHYNPQPHVVVINCLMGIGPEMKEQAGKRGNTANIPPSIASPFQKCLWWVQLWMHCQHSRRIERHTTLLDCSVISRAVPMPCKLQLCSAR